MRSKASGWLSWLATVFGAHREALPPHLRKPRVRIRGNTTELQFARGVSQSQMVTGDPHKLLIDYTRTMLGALVFVPAPRLVGMLGLGGGSQAKYCYRHLQQARIEVVENNPHVVALRRRFRIPDDDARFQVYLDEGARFLHERPGRYDLLLVDGYDETGIPAALSTQAFYDDCRACLAPRGALAINLYCAEPAAHVTKLQLAFGEARVLVIDEPRQSNRVAFAWIGDTPQAGDAALSLAAQRDLAGVFATVHRAMDSRRA